MLNLARAGKSSTLGTMYSPSFEDPQRQSNRDKQGTTDEVRNRIVASILKLAGFWPVPTD